ncbi:hypothetical protein SEPCBS119000_002767 [Sporothrix epigloea]|uniref:Rhodopsin domain-containing protein n=1 Tax=Sporothrix epigloea TaxID=1892477 RepID=A0ABP0DHZ1_9PEZI
MASIPSESIDDRGPAVFAVTTTTLVLCSVFVFSRLICRVAIVRRVGWDDYFIILAWLLAFSLSLTINLGTQTGLGRHDADIQADNRARLRICEYVFSILYNPALMATKTSVLVFYLRLSKNTIQVLRMGSYVVLVLVNVAGVVLTFINIFQCRPVEAAFTDEPGQCIPLLTEFICSAPVNIITDLAILALPIPVLTGMRLPIRQKTILVLTFALGIFVTIVDVVRIYYLQQALLVVQPGAYSDPNLAFGDGIDFAWHASMSFMWSAVEVNVGITCACIPTLKPLIIKIFPALVIDPYASSYGNSSHTRGLEVSNSGSRPAASQRLRHLPVDSNSPIAAVVRSDTSAATLAVLDAPDAANDFVPVADPDEENSGTFVKDRASSSPLGDQKLKSSEPVLDLANRQSPETTSNRISATDHAPQPLGPAEASTSRRSFTDEVPNNASKQAVEEAESVSRSPIARAACHTRHALSSVINVLHLSRSSHRKSHRSSKDTSLYFGFVKLHTPKNMLEASVSESIKYCTIVAVLFFLWGFSYGLLNTLNNVVASVAGISTAQTLGLTSAYFGGGYFFGPLVVGEWVLRHDEHSRREAGLHRNHLARDHQDKRSGTLASIPVTAASSGSATASAATHPSRYSDSGIKPIGGFKATFMVGLCIYGVGTMMFWPSAVLASFPGFMISSFVVGFGLAILETAANPFIALCGPMEYSEMRLLIAQGTQGVGSVLSGLLAQNVFFVNVDPSGKTNASTLLDVQWTYLAITLFCVMLTLFFYYMPLPELHDAELELAASKLPVDGKKKSVFGLQLRTVCLILAVLAQWTYVAAQESMSIYFRLLITSWLPSAQAGSATIVLRGMSFSSILSDMAASSVSPGEVSKSHVDLALSVPTYLLIAHTAFAVSRFFAGYIVYLGVKFPTQRWLPSPRTVLTISASLSALFALLIVVLKPSHNANLIMVPVTLFFLAEGPIWPLVFAIGLRGQGARTKRAAAYITMGASGPLFWPFVMYAILLAGGTVQIAFVVVVALMAVSTLYPLFLTFHRDARNLTREAPLDPRRPASDSPQADASTPARAAAPRPGVLDMSMLGGTTYSLEEHAQEEQKNEKEQARKQSPAAGVLADPTLPRPSRAEASGTTIAPRPSSASAMSQHVKIEDTIAR